MISSLYSCNRKRENESEMISITSLFCIQAGCLIQKGDASPMHGDYIVSTSQPWSITIPQGTEQWVRTEVEVHFSQWPPSSSPLCQWRSDWRLEGSLLPHQHPAPYQNQYPLYTSYHCQSVRNTTKSTVFQADNAYKRCYRLSLWVRTRCLNENN